jgi:hypothetical protein
MTNRTWVMLRDDKLAKWLTSNLLGSDQGYLMLSAPAQFGHIRLVWPLVPVHAK